MFTTILISALVLIGVVWLVVGPKVTLDQDMSRERKVDLRVWGIAPLLFAVVIAIFACSTIVQAKQVGVVTTFGKPAENTLSAGLHVKAPWQKVTEIDATIQTDEYHGDSAINVILSDKNTADISATIRWSVSAENANDVYADFRSDNPTESLRDAVVSTQFKAAVNAVFGAYDIATEGAADYDTLATEVTDKMLTKTRGLIEIDSITVSYIKPSTQLQEKIEGIQAQETKTRIATEALTTAEKQAAANRALSASVSNDPNVLVAQCFDLLAEGYAAPAGFSCWPGGGGAVVVPSK